MLRVKLSIILRNRVCMYLLKVDDQGCKFGILFSFRHIGRGHHPDMRVSSAIVTQGNRAIGPINSSDYGVSKRPCFSLCGLVTQINIM